MLLSDGLALALQIQPLGALKTRPNSVAKPHQNSDADKGSKYADCKQARHMSPPYLRKSHAVSSLCTHSTPPQRIPAATMATGTSIAKSNHCHQVMLESPANIRRACA